MKITLKVKVNNIKNLNQTIKEIKEIEKEHRCTCTLLEVEIDSTESNRSDLNIEELANELYEIQKNQEILRTFNKTE